MSGRKGQNWHVCNAPRERVCVCVRERYMRVLAVASMHEGETSWHCNSSGSNRIQLMTKLIEGLTPAVPDKAALLCVCVYVHQCFSVYVHAYL